MEPDDQLPDRFTMYWRELGRIGRRVLPAISDNHIYKFGLIGLEESHEGNRKLRVLVDDGVEWAELETAAKDALHFLGNNDGRKYSEELGFLGVAHEFMQRLFLSLQQRNWEKLCEGTDNSDCQGQPLTFLGLQITDEDLNAIAEIIANRNYQRSKSWSLPVFGDPIAFVDEIHRTRQGGFPIVYIGCESHVSDEEEIPSLLDAACKGLLNDFAEMVEGSPQTWNQASSEVEECERPSLEYTRKLQIEAGKQLLRAVTPMPLSKDWFRHFPVTNGWFLSICAVAALPYENRAANGRLSLRRFGADPNLTISLSETQNSTRTSGVSIHDHKVVRKLLEAAGDLDLIVVDGQVLGYGGHSRHFPSITFLKTGKWRLRSGGKDLMIVNFGIPEVPKSRFDKLRLHNAIIRIGCPPNRSDEFLEILEPAVEEITKGGLIVISGDASNAASDLQASCFRPEPFHINADHITRLSRMDGAIILDFDLKCHAFGAILDGAATEGENPQRGSRYNSAVRYVQSREGKAVAVVISEDGYVDVIAYKEPKPAQEELICG